MFIPQIMYYSQIFHKTPPQHNTKIVFSNFISLHHNSDKIKYISLKHLLMVEPLI